jgi:predicted LPLAT superfamily acyltransferase
LPASSRPSSHPSSPPSSPSSSPPSSPSSSASSSPSWAEQPERGGLLLVSALFWLVLGLGARASRVLLPPLSLWFLATSSAARRASRDYLSRALGRPARLRDVLRHFHSFGSAILDRVFLLSGRTSGFVITVEGEAHVMAAVAQRRGCILLGSHLGSFEVLRTLAGHAPAPVRALMFRRNAGALTRLLERLNPELNRNVIEIGTTNGMLQVRECIDRGEIVGILADRTPTPRLNGDRLDLRQVAVPFLGSKALFPAGPFVLAAMLGAPVVLFQGVRTGPQRYAIRFAPFADKVVLHRATRTEDLAAVIGRYAAALERGCREHPFNWFNFFAFWEHGEDAECQAGRAKARPTDLDHVDADRGPDAGPDPHPRPDRGVLRTGVSATPPSPGHPRT